MTQTIDTIQDDLDAIHEFICADEDKRPLFEEKMYSLQTQLRYMATIYPELYKNVETTNLGRWCRCVLLNLPAFSSSLTQALANIQDSVIQDLHVNHPITIEEIIYADASAPPPDPQPVLRKDGSEEYAEQLTLEGRLVNLPPPSKKDYELFTTRSSSWSAPMVITFVPYPDSTGKPGKGRRIQLPREHTQPKSESTHHTLQSANGAGASTSGTSTQESNGHIPTVNIDPKGQQSLSDGTGSALSPAHALKSRGDVKSVLHSAQPTSSAAISKGFDAAIPTNDAPPDVASDSVKDISAPMPSPSDAPSTFKGKGQSRKRGHPDGDEEDEEDIPTRPKRRQRTKLVTNDAEPTATPSSGRSLRSSGRTLRPLPKK